MKVFRAQVGTLPKGGALVGQSPAMQRVYDLLDRVADSDASVLITGRAARERSSSRASSIAAARAKRPRSWP